MKLVIDTVVIVRAFINPASRAGQLIDQYRAHYEMIASRAILGEYQEVTERPAIRRKYVAAANQKRAELRQRLSRVTLVEPGVIPAVCRDPNDDKFLAAAIAGRADYIVTEDLDLLSMGSYEGITICDTRAMIDLLASDAPT